MSVTNQTPYKQFVAAPGATLFSSEFRVILGTDLVVRKDGVDQSTGFTVSGLGNPSGVDVTFGVPMAGGESIELLRQVPLTRQTDYQQSGDFLSPVVNVDFDRLWMALQDSKFLSNLAILLPVGDPVAPMTIPDVAARASRFLAFDALGQPIAAVGAAGVPVSPYMATLLDDLDAAAARATLIAASSGANSDITSLSGLTTPLSVAQGGTGMNTALLPPGAVQLFALSAAPAGWLKSNGLTIGSAASGGTARANADTLALFTALWNNVAQADLPIQTSAGGASTRGASAAADFSANKRLPLPNLCGEFVRGLDDGRGVDASRALGSAQAQQTRVDAGRFNSASNVTAGQLSASNRISPAHASWDENINIVSPNHGLETRPRNIALLYCIKL